MPDISSSLSKREVNARQNTYTKSEIDLKDGAIQAIAEAAQTTADAAEKKNQEQDQLIAELQRSSHSHSNQAVLDKTEQPYTTAERDKLAGLENYTHPNYTAHAKGFYKVANDGKGHVTDAGKVTKKDITDLGIPGEDTNITYELALPTYASQKEPPAPMLSLNGSDGSENKQTIPCAYTVLDDIVYKEFSGFKIGGKYRSVADLAFVIPGSARIYPWRITANIAIETPSGNNYVDLHYTLEITDGGVSIRRYQGNGKYYSGNPCTTNDWAILSDLQNFSNPDRDVWLYRIGVPDDVFNKLTNAYCKARLVYQTGKNGDVVKPVSYYTDITFDENVHAMDTNLVYVLTKADVSDVAFTGSYNDLSDKPTIPDVSCKQDKLTAGANITLSGNTISAKDTTYGNASTSAAGLMSAVDKKKLAGIAAGAEVNQNAFSTIATGSARYAATAKQSAFLIDGDGGTSVSLDTKTGRLTVSSHTHDNKAVLDQLSEEQWKFINGAANKAHVHDNKGTLDKIDDVSWLTVYGQTHEHSNKAVLDKLTVQDYSDFKGTVNKAHVHSNKDTLEKLDMEWWAMWLSAYGNMHTHANKATLDKITDALVTKLSNMDLSKYLPLAGGVMNGDIDLASNGVDLLVGSQRATQTTYATAVAGATISTKQTFSSGLPERKSLVGSFLDQNSVWHSIISVRHRNGYNDGVNYGMYLRSLLTSDGSLIWNKQTGAGKWQGERVLLDSTNYSSYAAKSDHTHAMITNSALWVSGANNTAKWVKLGTLVSSGNFSNAMIRVWSGDGANGRANQNSSFEVQIKDGWQSTESATKACGVTVYRINCSSVKVKVIPTAHDTYTVWAYMPWGYWNGNYAIYGKYKSWTSQHLIQSEEPEGTGADTAYYDHAFLTSTVANATTWNGLINDVDTYNSSDTWILVKKDNRIQHRYAGELDVNSAKTLVDSGWQKPTFPSGVKSSSIRYRKQGKIVSVTGYVQFSTAQTTITVFTLPTGYRPPAKIQQFNAVDSSAQASFLTKIDTDGKVGFFGKTQGFFTTATEYYMHCTFFVD